MMANCVAKEIIVCPKIVALASLIQPILQVQQSPWTHSWPSIIYYIIPKTKYLSI